MEWRLLSRHAFDSVGGCEPCLWYGKHSGTVGVLLREEQRPST